MDVTALIKDQVRELILLNFPLAKTQSALSYDTPLLEAGIIDSMGVLDLLMELEDMFEISYEDGDLLPENFESISNIAACIQIKQLSKQGIS